MPTAEATADAQVAMRSLLDQSQQAYRHFRPRPDQPERYDQQEGFVNSRTKGVKFLIGGNGAGTSETVMHALSRFVLRDQAPPRYDTPFWIISGTYKQACATCWKEKLWGHGHIPNSEVDWDRVSWYRPNDSWPYRVPLLPWPGRPGRNWVLEFKSYEQGRQQMQAESIGGFAFIEQFPWGLLTEVNRGCREYNFPGSKMAEFTPIDPALYAPLEAMILENRLPKGWEIWRANTLCALEAGHVDADWFEEFFGSVPDEMRETRMTGASPQFEGSIYQGFNPAIHVVGDDVIPAIHPAGMHHRRSIDWGFGPDNAFAAGFAYRDGLGRWFVYDEYWSTSQVYECEDHLNDIDAMYPWPEGDPHFGTTYADPSSPEHFRTANRLGWNMTKASNAVYDGIDTVRSHLKVYPGLGIGRPGRPDGPKLYIHKRCVNLLREMRTYHWQTGTEKRDAVKAPAKKDDHAVDWLRYLLHSEKQLTGAEPGSMSTRDEDFGERHGVHVHGRRRR